MKQSGGRRDEILRFQKTEILLHWSIAVPFLTCYLSALAILALSLLGLELPVRPILSWIHRIAGCCLIALPPLALLSTRGQWRVHLDNIRQGWIWTIEDVRWLFLIGLAAANRKIHFPDQGKFNAGEKLNFMMVMTTYPLFSVTGILIWLPGTAFHAWIAHVAMAAAVTPLLIGHIFMAVINPATRAGLKGMITGWVDRRWARHHYARWYRETIEPVEGAVSGSSPSPVKRAVAGTAPVTSPPDLQEMRLKGPKGTELPPAKPLPAEAEMRTSPLRRLRVVARESSPPSSPGGKPRDRDPPRRIPGR